MDDAFAAAVTLKTVNSVLVSAVVKYKYPSEFELPASSQDPKKASASTEPAAVSLTYI